jgi:hypothetical protein
MISLNEEFVIKPSGFMLFFRRLLYVMSGLAIFSGLVEAISQRSPYPVASGCLNALITWSAGRYCIRTFPRKVSISGDIIIFHRVPKAWIDINGIPIPLGIDDQMPMSKADVVLEWIGTALTLNHMTKGKSIRLAAGKHAKELAQWLNTQGVSLPVGG